jgi:hypothetical protein
MRDEKTGEDPEDAPSSDPTSVLERLDADFEDLVNPDEPNPPLDRREIGELVDQAIAEELTRLDGARSKE